MNEWKQIFYTGCKVFPFFFLVWKKEGKNLTPFIFSRILLTVIYSSKLLNDMMWLVPSRQRGRKILLAVEREGLSLHNFYLIYSYPSVIDSSTPVGEVGSFPQQLQHSTPTTLLKGYPSWIEAQTRNVHNCCHFHFKYGQFETNQQYFYLHTPSGKYFFIFLKIYRLGF